MLFCERWFVDYLAVEAEKEGLPFRKGWNGYLEYAGPPRMAYDFWDALTTHLQKKDEEIHALLPPLADICPEHARAISFQKRLREMREERGQERTGRRV
jgi:hypothetical protein